MKLSVIVPVYNAEATLRQCVDSLLEQTIEDKEILLINDGSPDGCQAILDEYAARYPQRIRTKTVDNGGQGRARNFGLALAKGEWLGFVDSDDWIEPDMYESLIAAAEREGTDIAMCDLLRCYADGRREHQTGRPADRPLAVAGSCCDKVFRRKLVEDLRFPEGLWYEDFAYSALALARVGAIAYVPRPLYCYRIGHPSTMHNQNAAKNLDLLQVLDLLRDPLTKAGLETEFQSIVLGHALLDAIGRVGQQNAPDKATVIEKIRNYVNREIPDLTRCPAFRAESGRRRLIMWLNYHGLDGLSRTILRIKNG